jgi:hypothetical protein
MCSIMWRSIMSIVPYQPGNPALDIAWLAGNVWKNRKQISKKLTELSWAYHRMTKKKHGHITGSNNTGSNKRKRTGSNPPIKVPPKKKQRYQETGAEGRNATVSVYKKRKPTRKQKFRKKAFKKFKNKVDRAIHDKIRGVYTVTTTLNLQQTSPDLWGLQTADDGGYRLEFFTPKKLKDAEGICFNHKTASINSWQTTAITPALGENFQTPSVFRINNSYVKIRLRNCSQHHMIVEMYILRGIRTANGYNQTVQGEFSAIENTGIVYGNETDFTVFGSQFWHSRPFCKNWKYTKVVFNMVPGASANYFLQGPKNMCWKGMNHQGDGGGFFAPVWLGPEVQGNGCLLMFRTISEPTVDTGGKVHRFPNLHSGSNWGGIACEFTSVFNLAPPLITDSESDARVETAEIVAKFGSTTGNDQQIDEDNPAVELTLPT